MYLHKTTYSPAFISKWDKFFSLLFLFTSLFGFIYSESNLTTKFISIYLMFMCVYLIFILPTLRSKKMYKRYLAINNYEQLLESVNFYNDIFEVISSNGSRVSISYKNLKKIYNRNKMDPIWWTREKACLSIWDLFLYNIN